MSYKICFDIESLLGDTANSDFLGVEYLNCYEYNFWQIMRQSGINDYKAAINTRAFLKYDYEINSFFNIKLAEENLKVIKKNLLKYYGMKLITYKDYQKEELSTENKSLHKFIVNTLNNNKFVYVLYSHYHDSINDAGMIKSKKVYHSTVLTGYDYERNLYIVLVDGRYNIGFNDLDVMYEYFSKLKEDTRNFNVFYLCKDKKPSIVKNEVYAAISQDMSNVLLNWEEEINCYQSVIDKLNKLTLNNESKNYLNGLRIYFYRLRLGFNGNLYFKLKALEEFTSYSFNDYYEKFLENRKKSEVIANMIGKLLVDFSRERLERVVNKVDQVFLQDSLRLKKELAEILKCLKPDKLENTNAIY